MVYLVYFVCQVGSVISFIEPEKLKFMAFMEGSANGTFLSKMVSPIKLFISALRQDLA